MFHAGEPVVGIALLSHGVSLGSTAGVDVNTGYSPQALVLKVLTRQTKAACSYYTASALLKCTHWQNQTAVVKVKFALRARIQSDCTHVDLTLACAIGHRPVCLGSRSIALHGAT